MHTPMLPTLVRGVALGHVRGALDMARQDVLDSAVPARGGVGGVDRGAGHPERVGRPLAFEDRDGGLCGSHPGHGMSSLLLSAGAASGQLLDEQQQRGMVQTAVALGP